MSELSNLPWTRISSWEETTYIVRHPSGPQLIHVLYVWAGAREDDKMAKPQVVFHFEGEGEIHDISELTDFQAVRVGKRYYPAFAPW